MIFLHFTTIVEKPLNEIFFLKDQKIIGNKEFKELKRTIVDFLYRFKDKHPFGTHTIID